MGDYHNFSDQELSSLLQEDDRHAFAEIYERYKKALYVHAFHRLKDREEAKDLIQQLFTTLWDNRKSIVFKTSLSGYLYTSVRNRVFKLIAHQEVSSAYIASIEQSVSSGNCITDHLVREKELKMIIEKEIAALPVKMRQVFELSRIAHLSHREIARELNLSEKTVRNQINNALKTLRVKLGIFAFLLILLNL